MSKFYLGMLLGSFTTWITARNILPKQKITYKFPRKDSNGEIKDVIGVYRTNLLFCDVITLQYANDEYYDSPYFYSENFYYLQQVIPSFKEKKKQINNNVSKTN